MSFISLLRIWKPGNSVSEQKTKASIEPAENEVVFFLKMDCDEARVQLGMRASDKKATCDYVVFYTRRSKNSEERRSVLCLLELKGCDIDHAIDQVIATREHIKQSLRILQGTDVWPYVQRPTWKAYICCNPKSAIVPSKKYALTIEKAFGKNNFKITHNDDPGSFLRN
ncbi:MAG TPA: hypothetical protein VGF67_08630 [Ktedonobacteraceae bacterium]|jgi:hypothetical protein